MIDAILAIIPSITFSPEHQELSIFRFILIDTLMIYVCIYLMQFCNEECKTSRGLNYSNGSRLITFLISFFLWPGFLTLNDEGGGAGGFGNKVKSV